MITPDRTITVQIEQQDLLHAQQLHFGTNMRSRATLFRFFLLWLIGGAIFWVFLLSQMTLAQTTTPVIVFMLVESVCIFVIPIALFCLFSQRYARKTFHEQKSLHKPMTFTWDENGFAMTSHYGSALMAWSDQVRTAENTRMFLLFETTRLYRMVPKRAMTPQQIADLHDCIAAGRVH